MPRKIRLLIWTFALVRILIHLLANNRFGFHADELYYIALSKHLQWGYLDNGPFIGFIAAMSKALFGPSLFAYRLFPTLASGLTLAAVGYTTFYLGGKRLAIGLACVSIICSPAYLATSYFLQPIVFEHLFWCALALALIRYRQTENVKFVYLAAVVLALGILNKYTILLYAAALFPVSIKPKHLPFPFMVALVLLAPNIYWQAQHGFPLFHYIGIVRADTVPLNLSDYLFQSTFFHGTGVAVWLAGIFYLLISKVHRNYRFTAWAFIVTIAAFLILRGKIYYSLGAFPVLFAAGGVCWERLLATRLKVWRSIFYITIVLPALIALPAVIPILPFKFTQQYFALMRQYTNITAIFRWEDGTIHNLPQNYADMIGWPKLAQETQLALSQKAEAVIYTDNYGIAGALSYYLPQAKVLSPNNSFALWSPKTLNTSNFIYFTKLPVAGGTPVAGKGYLVNQSTTALQAQYAQQAAKFLGFLDVKK